MAVSALALDLEYAASLARAELRPVERGPWLVVGASPLKQGWKLHLSSIPTQATTLLRTVLPLLVAEGVSFKCARTPGVLAQLNEGDLGSTQIGKFITVYPRSPDHARQLALRLLAITAEFNGPEVVTDYALGNVVYARYGGHNPVIVRDRLGQLSSVIEWPNGHTAPDHYLVPFQCPEGVEDPFADLVRTRNAPDIRGESGTTIDPVSPKLFGPGYLVLDVLKEHAKGSVFRAIDLRSQQGVAAKVIKQGRRHCLSDEQGRDMRDRLRRQRTLHGRLCASAPVPQAESYFEVNGDGYLVLDYVSGETIENKLARLLRRRRWSALPIRKRERVLGWLRQLIEATERLHRAGFVHRDITASNVWIDDQDRVWLLDLELAHGLEDHRPAFGLGTAGFMSPQQAARCEPSVADDIYGIGCVLVLALTGLDPRRVLFEGGRDLFERLSILSGGASRALVDVVVRAVAEGPEARPSLVDLSQALSPACRRLRTSLDAGSRLDAVRCAIAGILDVAPRHSDLGIWLSASISPTSHHNGSRATGTLELRRSTNRGASGTVYFLSRASRLGCGSAKLEADVKSAVRWLSTDYETPDLGLPGLHFGEAGVSVAVAEAMAASLVERDEATMRTLVRGLQGPIDWPDVTHGAAGQGMAALICSDLLREPSLERFAAPCAQYLIDTQLEDGTWRMPEGVPGMSGEVLSGFAHGVAGMAYFLAVYAFRFGDESAHRAWPRALDWLERNAIDSGRTAEWSYSDTRPVRWAWWCHGGPGIALTLLKLYQLTGESRVAKLATRALSIHPKHMSYPNLTQCHGLSGLGETYLEAARSLGDSHWIDRADDVGRTLLALGRERLSGKMVWLAEDPNLATADLMVGGAGIGHFLLRLAHLDRIGPPLLP